MALAPIEDMCSALDAPTRRDVMWLCAVSDARERCLFRVCRLEAACEWVPHSQVGSGGYAVW